MLELGWGTPSYLAAAGIGWDLLGATALAKGLVLNNETIRRRSGSYWDLSPPAVRGFCEQRIDAKFGLGQLGIGFTLQLIAAIGLQVSCLTAVILMVPVGLAWLAYYFQVKEWTLRASLRFASPDTTEDAWRVHFKDLPDHVWKRVIASAGLTFQKSG